jgi:hypothetical protein
MDVGNLRTLPGLRSSGEARQTLRARIGSKAVLLPGHHCPGSCRHQYKSDTPTTIAMSRIIACRAKLRIGFVHT